MKKARKTKYNIWQNTAFMLANAWHYSKSVIFLCAALAVVTASRSVAELLIAPVILKKVENAAPLPEVITTITVFSVTLLILAGLRAYIDANTLFGRIAVRIGISRQVDKKLACTSYPNTLDTEFISFESKASDTCSSNEKAAEHIWTTWTGILTNAIGFTIYLALLSGLHPLLICIVTSTTIMGYFINHKINEWGYRHREEEAAHVQQMRYIHKTATERDYAKDIRIFCLRDWIDDVWYSALNRYQAFLFRREKVYTGTNVTDLLLTLLRNGAAYAYLIRLTLANSLDASEFLLYFTAVTGFTQWITGILEQFEQLHRESLDLSILREFLEWPEPFKFEDDRNVEKVSGANYEIRLEDVTFRYPEAKQDTLSHINLTIHPGEKLAIVGLNGAGKTTLVKLVCGFLDPTRGRVLLNGKDIREYNRRDYYSLFSAVFQDFSVLEASVAENVAQRVDDINETRVWSCLEQAGLTKKIKSLPQNLHTKIGRRVYEDGAELSGGQIQRLMLARALYKDGPVLVLDEPTAALDPIAENDIYLKYNEMTARRTSLFISHRLASTRFCNRILYLENGKIAEEGTHETLLSLGGAYAKLFEVQSQYYKEGGNRDEG